MSGSYLKRIVIVSVLGLAIVSSSGGHASDDKYIYHHRVNYVKLDTMPKAEIAEAAANHPYKFSVEQMRAMLLSLRLSRRHLIKKEVSQQEIFIEDEAEQFAPYLVQAFAEAAPDQWIVLSIVQKRPYFIIRDDHLTVALLWIEGDKLHVRFKKVYAKLIGDYEAASNQQRLTKQASSVRISLEPGAGQMLSDYGEEEILLDTHYNFASPPAPQSVAETPKDMPKSTSPAPTVPAAKKSVKQRLEELDALKKQGLISPKEYEEVRKSILSDI